MNQARRVDSMVMLSETATQSASRSKRNQVVMSSAHLKRLNRISGKFKRCNDQNVDMQNQTYQSMALVAPGSNTAGQDMKYNNNGQKMF
jgi:alpha-acetolactate decarboxylase